MNTEPTMKNERAALSRRYCAELQDFLREGSGTGMDPARELGRQAMTLGLETLDLARIHEIAVASLEPPGSSDGNRGHFAERAGIFFAEVISPIEETHRGAREANALLKAMIEKMTQRTLELADSNEGLKQEVAKRRAVEKTLRLSEETSTNLLAKSLQMQKEMRLLSHELLSAHEEERKKISRELHDVIAQTLSGINVQLANLKTESTANNKDLIEKIESTRKLVAQSVDIVHRFARELRPSLLDDLGLIPALESFMKTFMDETGVRVTLKAFAGIEECDNARRTALYRIAQEALNNVARHSGASAATVSIENLGSVIRMEISDNGQGFEMVENQTDMKSKRLGLLGMRERAEMVGGTFCVKSEPEKGTIVRVEIQPDAGRTGTELKMMPGAPPTLENR
jgi:signal transduction histidine kinase